MKRSMFFSLLMGILCITVGGCSQKRITWNIDVPPLEGVLQEFDPEVKAWDPQAYVYMVHLPLQYEDFKFLSVFYDTPNIDKGTLSIYRFPDGTIELYSSAGNPDGSLKDPITKDDWSIESQEAVEIFVANIEENSHRYKIECSFMVLERAYLPPSNPVIWRLTLTDCAYSNAVYYYLDALTGEMILDAGQ